LTEIRGAYRKWILTDDDFDSFTDGAIEAIRFLKDLYHNRENYLIEIPDCGKLPLKEVKFVVDGTNSVKLHLETEELIPDRFREIREVCIVKRSNLPFHKPLKKILLSSIKIPVSPKNSFTFGYDFHLSSLKEFLLKVECREEES